MKIKTLLIYLSIPTIFSLGVFFYALDGKTFSLEMIASVLLGGFLFYAAPYLIWAVIIKVVNISNVVAHYGMLSLTMTLFFIASVWFSPGDPSGLPMQWLLYWPLALISLLVGAGGSSIYLRIKFPNK